MTASFAVAASWSLSGKAANCEKKGSTVWEKEAQSLTDSMLGRGNAMVVERARCWQVADGGRRGSGRGRRRSRMFSIASKQRPVRAYPIGPGAWATPDAVMPCCLDG